MALEAPSRNTFDMRLCLELLLYVAEYASEPPLPDDWAKDGGPFYLGRSFHHKLRAHQAMLCKISLTSRLFYRLASRAMWKMISPKSSGDLLKILEISQYSPQCSKSDSPHSQPQIQFFGENTHLLDLTNCDISGLSDAELQGIVRQFPHIEDLWLPKKEASRMSGHLPMWKNIHSLLRLDHYCLRGDNLAFAIANCPVLKTLEIRDGTLSQSGIDELSRTQFFISLPQSTRATHLTNLALTGYAKILWHHLIALLPTLSQLETLMIQCFLVTLTPRNLKDLVPCLPQTLQALRLEYIPEPMITGTLEGVMARLPELRYLSTDLAHVTGDLFRDIKELGSSPPSSSSPSPPPSSQSSSRSIETQPLLSSSSSSSRILSRTTKSNSRTTRKLHLERLWLSCTFMWHEGNAGASGKTYRLMWYNRQRLMSSAEIITRCCVEQGMELNTALLMRVHKLTGKSGEE